MPRKRSKIIYCKNCTKDTGWYRASYCDDCVKQGWHLVRLKGLKPIEQRTLQEVIESETSKRRANKYNSIRVHARTKVKKLNIPLQCVNCSYNKHVEVCHITPINGFDQNTLVSVVNADTNLTLLCPNCHWEFDNKLISVTSVSNRVTLNTFEKGAGDGSLSI